MYTVFSVAYTMSELALTAMHNPTEDKVQPTAVSLPVKGPLGEYTQEHQIQLFTSTASKKGNIF